MARATGKYYRVTSVTDDTAITGSIAKIYSACESGSVVNVFDDVKFGIHSSLGDGIVSSSFHLLTDNFTLACGSYLEGPIAGFSLNADGVGVSQNPSVLVYFND